ncbi:peroxiredoxin family protein, partial [Bacteroides graminisolvens]
SKLWPEFKDNANFKLLVIGRDHTNEELKTYNTKKNFTFPLYADKGRVVFDSFASSTIPRSYLIDKDGKVIHISIGFNETEFSELMQKIEEAIK